MKCIPGCALVLCAMTALPVAAQTNPCMQQASEDLQRKALQGQAVTEQEARQKMLDCLNKPASSSKSPATAPPAASEARMMTRVDSLERRIARLEADHARMTASVSSKVASGGVERGRSGRAGNVAPLGAAPGELGGSSAPGTPQQHIADHAAFKASLTATPFDGTLSGSFSRHLQWSSLAGATRYLVLRDQGDAYKPPVVVANTSGTSYDAATLPGATFRFRVIAVAGTTQDTTAVVSVGVPQQAPPQLTLSVTCAVAADHEVVFTIQAPSVAPTRYHVEYRRMNGSTVASTLESYVDPAYPSSAWGPINAARVIVFTAERHLEDWPAEGYEPWGSFALGSYQTPPFNPSQGCP